MHTILYSIGVVVALYLGFCVVAGVIGAFTDSE